MATPEALGLRFIEMDTTDPKIIDGKALALEHKRILAERIKDLRPTRQLVIVSFCNVVDKDSRQYTRMKAREAESLGIRFITEEYSTDVTKEILEEKILEYNDDPDVDGVMIQLATQEVAEYESDLVRLIIPEKDVDGLTLEGRRIYLPATVRGVMAILDERVGNNWEDKRIAEVGSTGTIGVGIMEALRGREIEDIVEIALGLGDITQDLKDRDIVIATTGVESLVKPDYVKDGVVLIDVGLKDIDPEALKKASLYTPRQGGVGPMTVISLFENLVDAYERKVV